MTVYYTSNLIDLTNYYICPDQATIDQGKVAGYNGIFSIGTEADAQSILNICQQNWLNACVDRFSVNKDIDSDPVQTTWIPCDLNNEPQNTDQDYEIFNTIHGQYVLTTGLDNAKELLVQVKQNFLVFSGLGSVTTWSTWPPLPTKGLQTL